MRGNARSRSGQTPTEYLMIAGLVTAMIIVLSGIIIPTMRDVTVRLARHIIVNLSSPASAATDDRQPCPEFVELEPDPGQGEEPDPECQQQ
jgi:hypothetical protein